VDWAGLVADPVGGQRGQMAGGGEAVELGTNSSRWWQGTVG